ncbi:MAG: Gfo/Idh/MocA family protein [Bilifractor sp.]|jgi:predicted dehydrogenase
MKTLHIAIIGTGVIATTKHIPNLIKRDDVEITVLCDVDTEKAQKVKEEFGLNGAVITPDWREAVRSKDVDVVHVCTPNPLHYEITMAAFENGKHVHCEKPIALNYRDAKTMADTAKTSHLKFTTGTQWRYNPAPMRMKQMVKDGVFGDIFYIKSQQLRPRRLPAYGVYTSKELNGGGVLMDGGPHSIDLPMWLTDNYEVDSVRGVTFDKMKNFPEGNDLGPWDPKHFDVEDTAMAMITMKNGMLIYMETAWASNLIQPAMGVVAEICGNKAGADMVGPGFENHVRLTRVVNGKLTTTTEKIDEQVDMNAYDINHWIDAIQNDGDPAVLPEQAVTVVRVVEAIYKSAATGETVHF